jgi:DNA-binding NarL/FixJ family response regulator
MADRKTVLLVDDHPLFREGVKGLLHSAPVFEVIGEAGSAREALDLARKQAPDLAIVDISLPDRSGIELTRALRNLAPALQVLIVSMHTHIDYIVEAFQAGARGYVTKESSSERLVQGLKTVAGGEFYVDSTLSHRVVKLILETSKEETRITDEKYSSLTPREEEVLRLLVEGFTSSEIADNLYISPKTVENHRTNIMNKLGLHSTLELVRYAVKIGLIDPERWKN